VTIYGAKGSLTDSSFCDPAGRMSSSETTTADWQGYVSPTSNMTGIELLLWDSNSTNASSVDVDINGTLGGGDGSGEAEANAVLATDTIKIIYLVIGAWSLVYTRIHCSLPRSS